MKHHEWWTAQQLAEHYELSRSTVYKLMDSGELPYHVMGGRKVNNADRLAWEENTRVENRRKQRGRAFAPRMTQEEAERRLERLPTA
jgi:excisionase family DNA binding protein